MYVSPPTPWRDWATAVSARWSRSIWRLPVLLLGSLVVVVGPLYLLRGPRLVLPALAGSLGLVAAGVLFAQPFATVLLGVFVMFSGLDVFLPGPAALALLMLAAARAGYDFLDGARSDWGTPLHRGSLVVLFAIALTSLLWAFRPELALVQLRDIVLGLALYITISHHAATPSRIVAVLLVLVLGYATAIAIEARTWIGIEGAIGLAMGARFSALGTDANSHAGYASCILAPLVCILVRFRGWRRWVLLPVLLLLIVSTVLSQSRAGLALFCLVSLAIMLRNRRYGRGVAGLLVLSIGILVMTLPERFWVRFVSLSQLSGIVVDRALLLRQHILTDGLRLFLDHFWTGVGFGNFRVHAPHFMLGSWVAHNAYLEIGAGLGIFGLLAYLAWLVSGFGMARTAARRFAVAGREENRALAESIAMGILAFALMGLTLSTQFSQIIWLFFGAANAARRAAEDA